MKSCSSARWRDATENMKLVERFRRIGPDSLEYTYTVTDPETWTSPWTATIPMQRGDLPLYEYACHEGNYALGNIMRGARMKDADDAKKKTENKK